MRLNIYRTDKCWNNRRTKCLWIYIHRHYPLLQTIPHDIKPFTAHSSWNGYVFRVPCFRITVS